MDPEYAHLADGLVAYKDSQGLNLTATLLRLTRYVAVVEVYNPAVVLRTSEVLSDFRIVQRGRTIYLGRAVVSSLVNTGMVSTCEVSLDEKSWNDVEFTVENVRTGRLQEEFRSFVREWEKTYRVATEYKVIIADMQTYLSELRLWLDQVQLGISSSPSGNHLALEQEVAEEVARPVIPCVNVLFEKFEEIAEKVPQELVAAHRNYMRRQLHALVLCSPFAYRCFQKPLGYAGDYEMVSMILRNRHEGGSLFAKVVNTWFLRQPPAEAHRNRIRYLTDALSAEVLRARSAGRRATILNFGCGPAEELRAFIQQSPLRNEVSVTLADFSEEALQYARSVLEADKRSTACQAEIAYVKTSVLQFLKESSRTVDQAGKQSFDFVYCAGLFDYLPDKVCQRLMALFYEQVAPGGLLVATNVEPANPLRHGMEHLLDWHLIYRTAPQLLALSPGRAPADEARVVCEETGVNLFLEVRKPKHA